MQNWTHLVKKQTGLLLGGLLLGLLLLPGTAAAQEVTNPSPLLPASPNASLVAGLFWLVFWMAVVVFILVEGLIIYAAIRFRRRADDEQPVQVHGNTRAEIAWTIGPALIAVAIGILSLQIMWTDQRPTAEGVSPISVASVCFSSDISEEEISAFLADSTLTIEITGNQWWWEMAYTDYDFITAADLYVPAGEVVSLKLSSRDVVHAWWIPQLGGKIDVYPGARTYTWFQVTEPGVYEGHCTEMCGESHAYMPMRVVALPPEEFEVWAQEQQDGAPEPATELEQRGAELMASKGCVGCHAVGGLTDVARVGPNLTNFAERQQVAGVLSNDPENVREWLANPLEVKPGTRMPNLNLTDEELDALVAYMNTLR